MNNIILARKQRTLNTFSNAKKLTIKTYNTTNDKANINR